MTAPSNKKRTHNAAARDARRVIPVSKGESTGHQVRRTPAADRLLKLRAKHEAARARAEPKT